MRKYLLLLTASSIIFFAGCQKTTEDLLSPEDLFVTKEATPTVSGKFVPNELLIKFKKGTGEKSRTQTLSFVNGKIEKQWIYPTFQIDNFKQEMRESLPY